VTSPVVVYEPNDGPIVDESVYKASLKISPLVAAKFPPFVPSNSFLNELVIALVVIAIIFLLFRLTVNPF
jgi:hypothetical protein